METYYAVTRRVIGFDDDGNSLDDNMPDIDAAKEIASKLDKKKTASLVNIFASNVPSHNAGTEFAARYALIASHIPLNVVINFYYV